MPTAVVLPRLGNSVESSVIVRWLKQPGDRVAIGDPLCEVETDKATMEVASTAEGVLLEQLAKAGDDVPVQTPIALVGVLGETQPAAPLPAISPRSRNLAAREGLEAGGLTGSGPGGRVIERDVRAALASPATTLKLTPLARVMVEKGGFAAPAIGSGPGGRVMGKDLVGSPVGAMHASPLPASTPLPSTDPDIEVIPIAGVRKLIAERMLASLQSTAQLTLTRSADARQLQLYRRRLKESPESFGLRGVTINDLVLFAVARTLPQFPALNATFEGQSMRQYRRVQLGMAVDTPRGLLVPVVRDAETRSLRILSQEAARLAQACVAGKVVPDELSGGTFTVSNLGSLGIESFTPVLNVPQVAILGVGAIQLKPVEQAGEVAFIPHMSLSLTINHQVVDGAPAARFLQALAENIASLDVVLAV